MALGGGGASEKQLNNQLDCWWKAKGSVDERPESDESQPLLAFGDDVWKAEENGRIVVCRHHDCHRRGGARGGGDLSGEDRGKRGKKQQDHRRQTTTAMPVFDDGNDGIRTGQSPSIHRRCASYPIMPSRWGCCGAQSSTAPLLSSVKRCCWRGEGPGLVGGDCDCKRFGVHADPQRSGNDDDDIDDDNEDDYDYMTGNLSLLATSASFGDGVGTDAQITANNIIS